MKKLLGMVVIGLSFASVSRADALLDQLYAGFVGNAKFAIESTTKGVAKPEFLVNYIEVGQSPNGHLAALDAGIGGTILPDNSHFRAAEWSIGGKLHLGTILKGYIKLPHEWQFLNEQLELDLRGSYNFTSSHPFYGIVASVPFK